MICGVFAGVCSLLFVSNEVLGFKVAEPTDGKMTIMDHRDNRVSGFSEVEEDEYEDEQTGAGRTHVKKNDDAVSGAPMCFKCDDPEGGIKSVWNGLGTGSLESADARYEKIKEKCESIMGPLPWEESAGDARLNDFKHQCKVWNEGAKDIKHVTCNADDSFNFRLLTADVESVALVSGKQRVEMKVFGKSLDSLKGFEGETMKYSWRFRASESMALSYRFTHLFQFKFVSKKVDGENIGDTQKPAATLTAVKPKGGLPMELQVRNTSTSALDENVLATVPWSDVAGEWVKVDLTATNKLMEDGGNMQVIITRESDNKQLLSIDSPVDMWRVGNDFCRPKWGIYRAFDYKTQSGKHGPPLNDASVDFSDICIQKM